eukprot:GHVN01034960.1.p1 GENE.GHVN01034960.1~~GHVN01034960.1.p1  ORF type:complete len:471 (+),score=76.96 GHVN01034960.1:2331-3743(+)
MACGCCEKKDKKKTGKSAEKATQETDSAASPKKAACCVFGCCKSPKRQGCSCCLPEPPPSTNSPTSYVFGKGGRPGGPYCSKQRERSFSKHHSFSRFAKDRSLSTCHHDRNRMEFSPGDSQFHYNYPFSQQVTKQPQSVAAQHFTLPSQPITHRVEPRFKSDPFRSFQAGWNNPHVYDEPRQPQPFTFNLSPAPRTPPAPAPPTPPAPAPPPKWNKPAPIPQLSVNTEGNNPSPQQHESLWRSEPISSQVVNNSRSVQEPPPPPPPVPEVHRQRTYQLQQAPIDVQFSQLHQPQSQTVERTLEIQPIGIQSRVQQQPQPMQQHKSQPRAIQPERLEEPATQPPPVQHQTTHPQAIQVPTLYPPQDPQPVEGAPDQIVVNVPVGDGTVYAPQLYQKLPPKPKHVYCPPKRANARREQHTPREWGSCQSSSGRDSLCKQTTPPHFAPEATPGTYFVHHSSHLPPEMEESFVY